MDEEIYQPRGLGLNFLTCYMCNSHESGAQPDLAAFVQSRESGTRIIEMFEQLGLDAHLDYRPHEPNWVQVKVGACYEHKPNLEKLQELCEKDKYIDHMKIINSLI